jgi:hypothetical protein
MMGQKGPADKLDRGEKNVHHRRRITRPPATDHNRMKEAIFHESEPGLPFPDASSASSLF